VKVKPTEAEFNNLSKVTDESIEDTADGSRVRLGVIGRLETALRSTVAFHHDTLTS